MPDSPWIEVKDYRAPQGWTHADPGTRARDYCAALERGEILFFPAPPFAFPEEDVDFLLSQRWAELRMHKNVSYRPADDVLRGVAGSAAATTARIHSALRNYSTQVIDFLSRFLSPYASRRILDFASFRPFEEDGRDLPLHKRNDLLHVDAFPSRPTRGGRILRVFTNLNKTKPRVWETTGPFESIARQFAEDAGLLRTAENDSPLQRAVREWGRKLGIRGMGRTPYDLFMLRFHDFLKENSRFQALCPKTHLEFPPLATWMVFTDGVAHAVMSGQYALEQTFLIPASALVMPEEAPYRILEKIAGRPLVH
jgi:hypothetical protein